MMPTRNAAPQTAAIAPRRVDPVNGPCSNLAIDLAMIREYGSGELKQHTISQRIGRVLQAGELSVFR